MRPASAGRRRPPGSPRRRRDDDLGCRHGRLVLDARRARVHVGVIFVVVWPSSSGRRSAGSTTPLPHTVSASDGSWDPGNLAPGQAFERGFDTAGEYSYLCRYHPGLIGAIEAGG